SLADLPTGKPLPPGWAAQFLMTLARAIQHAHDHGIVHRDLKPANILLRGEVVGSWGGEQSPPTTSLPHHFTTPKISDFGLAKYLDEGSLGHGYRTQTGVFLGTPSYMAPEQTGSAGGGLASPPVGAHTDLYALGAILYHLLTGRPPFAAASPLETML